MSCLSKAVTQATQQEGCRFKTHSSVAYIAYNYVTM